MSVTVSFIDGDFVDSPQHYDNVDPSTSRPLGAVARGGAEEVERAVAAARQAFDGWRKVTPVERSAVLSRVADAVDGQRERLAILESEDTGKPPAQARADAAVAVRYFRFYAHAIDSYYGLAIPSGEDFHVYHVVAFDARPEAIEQLVELGAHAASSPRDVADRAETVLASLPSLQASLDVATGVGGSSTARG